MGGCAVSSFQIRSGDLVPSLVVLATSTDPRTGKSTPIDFTNAAGALLMPPQGPWTDLVFVMRGPSPGAVTGPATGDVNGYLEYDWQAGDTAVPGIYEGYFQGVSPGGSLQTFPTTGYIEIDVGVL